MRIEVLIIGLFLILIPAATTAQLFVNNELYPATKIIKGKYYNGTGVGRYWSLDYVDPLGRVVKKESYHEYELMSRQEIVYDDNNNEIFEIQTFDFNNPERIDTNRYVYKYAGDLIIYQFQKLSDNDSTVTELIENQGDSLLRYQERDFNYRPKSKTTDVYETIHTLRFKNGLLVTNEKFDKEKGSSLITNYEYFENSRLKRRVIERIPEPIIKSIYAGGPGSDDESYKYKLDAKGRIVIHYKIVNGKKYKIAVYKFD